MALDTSREAVRRFERKRRRGTFVGTPEPMNFAYRIAAARAAHLRRRRRWFSTGAVAVAALILAWHGPGDYAPDIRDAALRLSLVTEPTCGEIAGRYDRAVDALGTGWEVWAREEFDDARSACVRRVAAMTSTSRADTCLAGSARFASAFDLERASRTPAAVAPEPGSTIGMSAAAILGGEDPEELRTSARRLVAECPLGE